MTSNQKRLGKDEKWARAVTIKDIAARVGVSNMTVSAVLSRTESGHVRVSEATRARVLHAAQEMQYRPNRAARSLRVGAAQMIGIYSSHGFLAPHVAFTSQLLGGLHHGCDTHHKDLLLHGSYRDHAAEAIVDELADGRVDGLVLYTTPTDPLVVRLAQSHLPVVAVVDALPGLPSVVADDAGGARLLAAHLAARGHRRVLFRAGQPSLTSAVCRQNAFLEAAAALGMTVTISGPTLSGSHHEQWAEADLAWLDQPRAARPTAVACWNDHTAYYLLRHCQDRGLRLPEDLAVVGYDAILPPASTPWRLTTIRAPWVDVAHAAVDAVMQLLRGETLPPQTILPVTLVAGDTTQDLHRDRTETERDRNSGASIMTTDRHRNGAKGFTLTELLS